MNNLAIIPARGGSKRIPRKNIKKFLGKPILAYSIEAAIGSGLFSEVIVSTDDHEIAEIAQKYGAKVPFFRSAKNSGDFATTFDVVEEVIIKYAELGVTFADICCIYPCAPFVRLEILNEAYSLFKAKKFDSVFPVVKFSNPVQRALKMIGEKIIMVSPEFQNVRSQDLEPRYFDAGQFYWLNSLALLEQKLIFSNNSGSIILDELSAHDIDNEIDWEIAELKYSLIKK
jgi:pseudaminic acid cytidylyltransferase